MGSDRWRQARAFMTGIPMDRASPIAIADVLDYQLAELRRAPVELVDALPTKHADLRHVLAREHYFSDWHEAYTSGRLVDANFEAAADAIVDGDLASLRRLLDDHPELVHARSPYGHRSTLLHHVAANGIEVTRQWQSPANAPELARALLAAGSDVDASSFSYGRPDTTLTLVVSSCHPAAAGVQAALVDVLADAGADVNADGGTPLWTAIVFGYDRAIDRLVAHGARLDNLIFAACANDLPRMRELLDAPGPSRLGATALDPRRVRDYATIYAAGLGRREAVALLLEHGPDLAFRDPVYGITALDAARHSHPAAGRADGNPEIAAMLARAS